jgi:uncharacterized protein YyaL (SSP411 family)
LASGKTENTNRLIFQKSPYLLQHAHNPVDWYAWTDEAFSKAKEENKPIFLSIGYSSCHWCQVMESESFEDQEVAALLNEHFVSIKVDREERPDIDHIYMSVCQSMTGSGGWPLTVIMTPEKMPFFAGTYLPKEAKFGHPGIIQILSQIVALWDREREKVLDVGSQVAEMIRTLSASSQPLDLSVKNMEEAYLLLESSFDGRSGGFGQAPKFPSPHNLAFLLRWWKRSGDQKALNMVEKTLDAMWRGGMYDHLGYGFHRYSTDAQWLVPHFEKMLYDQALLSIAYVEAYQVTGRDRFAEVARQILTYVLRDMTSPEGAFYSSENADSEGEEGRFYVWTEKEIKDVLGDEPGTLFCHFYGVTPEGNFEGHRNVLHVPKPFEDVAKDEGMQPEELKNALGLAGMKLLTARNRRVHPSKDDKILTDWNGLMIAALSRAAQALDEPEYALAARRAAVFLLKNLRRSDGRLWHRYRDGEAAILAYIDDYAFLIWGLLDLYETVFEPGYLKDALDLADEMIKLFWDGKDDGFFFTATDAEEVLARSKQFYDGAVPSGSSIAVLDLLRLARMTASRELDRKAQDLLRSFGGRVSRSPTGFTQFLAGLDFALGPTKEIVIAGGRDEKGTREMIKAVHERFLPRKVLILHPANGAQPALENIAPFVKEQKQLKGGPTAYVCVNYACKLPTTDVGEMLAQIESE